MSARQLGPHQQRRARLGAQHIHYWAADLVKAIEQNDVETAEKLTQAITDQVAATAKVVKAAKPARLRLCTCGGSDYVSCLCNLTPREWLAYAQTNPRVDPGITLSKGMRS